MEMFDSQGDAFQRTLKEVWRNGRPEGDENESRSASLRRMRTGVDLGPLPSAGGEERFGLAMGWAGGQPDRPRPQAAPRDLGPTSAATPAQIAVELGLGRSLTLAQLTARWRDFVWRNHPDRQPVQSRARADARVAIANALYDRARREIKSGR